MAISLADPGGPIEAIKESNAALKTVVEGSRDREVAFQERWELALDGPDDAPWRVVGVAAR